MAGFQRPKVKSLGVFDSFNLLEEGLVLEEGLEGGLVLEEDLEEGLVLEEDLEEGLVLEEGLEEGLEANLSVLRRETLLSREIQDQGGKLL